MKFKVFIFVFIAIRAESQSLKSNIIQTALADKKVVHYFRPWEDKSDTLMLLDIGNIFAGEKTFFKFDSKIVELGFDTSLNNKLTHFDPFFLFQGRCKYYLLKKYTQRNKIYTVEIMQPCTNSAVKIRIKRSKKKLEVVNVFLIGY